MCICCALVGTIKDSVSQNARCNSENCLRYLAKVPKSVTKCLLLFELHCLWRPLSTFSKMITKDFNTTKVNFTTV
jgi:hypothetical protein